MFLLGLFAFLLAHISYVTGFKEESLTVTAWSLILAVLHCDQCWTSPAADRRSNACQRSEQIGHSRDHLMGL